MPHPVRKFYKPGSPGYLRKERFQTLSSIKKTIAASSNKSAARAQFRAQGLLG